MRKTIWHFLSAHLASPASAFLAVASFAAFPSAGAARDLQDRGEKTVVSAVGPHSRTWVTIDAKDLQGKRASGSAGQSGHSQRRIIELATGMNYWDSQANDWSPSESIFESVDGGFVASKVQHKTRLAQNINVTGAVSLTTPEGIELESTPLAIGLYDPSTGESIIIGTITNSAGVLISSNQVIYQNAFNGVSADVVYSIERSSFAQDIVINEQIDPANWNFPTNSQIQIITEFYNASEPDRVRRPIRIEPDKNKRDKMVTPDFVDTTLGFGEFVLGLGKAYTMADTNGICEGALVGKDFVRIGNRRFLVESVEYTSLKDLLQALPQRGEKPEAMNNRARKTSAKKAYAALSAPGGKVKVEASLKKPMQVAQLGGVKHAGVVIDYIATLGGTISSSQVFTSGTTWYVSGTVVCNGALTIEGGAVVKYKTDASITCNSSVSCKSGAYSPAIFTSMDDNSVGESLQGISGYNANPAATNRYANPALSLNYPTQASLNNLRFCYCKQAVNITGYANSLNFPLKISDSQIVSCLQGISVTITGCGYGGCGVSPAAGVNVNNTLFDNVDSAVSFPLYYISPVPFANFTHCTLGKIRWVLNAGYSGSGAQLYFTNSILASVTNLYNASVPSFNGAYNGFYNSPTFGSVILPTTANPFQPMVVAGAYYLADSTTFRNAGISSTIDGYVLASIRAKTTYPPAVLTNMVKNDTLLTPQVQRDTDAPDLGFHYDPIDYVGGFIVTNATLTLSNGVVIASTWRTAISVQDGATIISEGTPKSPNRFVDYLLVQEQPIIVGSQAAAFVSPYRYNSIGMPAKFRFTEFRHLKGGPWTSGMYSIYTDGGHWAFSSLDVRDCYCSGGAWLQMYLIGSGLTVKNNLFDFDSSIIAAAGPATFQNNLFRGGEADFFADSTCVVRDNAFDSAYVGDYGDPTTHDHNAYINTPTGDFPTNGMDIVLTNFVYASGPLGNYYQSSTNLRDKGSQTAGLLGLYHHTTQSSLAKETNSVVDIGFHYVATDSSGKPLDKDGDGVADYVEDTDGNGIYSSAIDLCDWQTLDTDGDGVSDGIEIAQGRKLRVGAVTDTTDALQMRVYTPLK